ncbi:MAG: tetratricopeptide repeat protein [Candidatus Delongbacteria bacterium]|nr:tetratricopeptide repeat protein [Candidatus Delongbacteria bacterium]
MQNKHALSLLFSCLLLLQSTAQSQGADNTPDETVLNRWAEISTMRINPQADAWIDEGNLIVANYQELQQLQTSTLDSLSRVQVEKNINELAVRLNLLLKKVEQARIFSLPPEELRALRERYQKESDSLEVAYGVLREQILIEGDNFLNTYPDEPLLRKYKRKDVVADMCFRLGELSQQKAREEYFDRLDDYEERQRSARDRGMPFNEAPPQLDLSRAVELYLKIVNEFPNSDYVADALYNLANIRENSEDPVEQWEAVEFYTRLSERFPDSRYTAEAWMRIGEYWYSQGSQEDYRRAIDAYIHVLDYPEYVNRDKTLYKLGWTHYQVLEYDQSVSYFTQAVEYTRQQVAAGEEPIAALEEESIRYIAINFADPEWEEGGVANLAAYIRERDAVYNDFGFTLALTFADILKQEALDYRLAVAAYDSVLSLYPLTAEGPLVLQKLIECYADKALNRPEQAYQSRNRFGELFVENDAWLEENSADTVVAAARTVMNLHQLSNVNQALQLANRDNSEAAYEEFLQQSRHYLQLFPGDSSAFQVHWNMAKILETPLKRYDTAWAEFLLITNLYHPTRDVMPAAINGIVMAQFMIELSPPLEPDSAIAWPLTGEEEMLVEALERFVELFPEAEQSPEYLFNTGGLYHRHRLWSQARVQFDRIIMDYPHSVLISDAYLFCIEGFFAEENFAAAEQKALELLALEPAPEIRTRAEQAVAQAVFSGAKLLSGGDDHLAAAAEFKRVALDVPDADFADASLFDAAAEYRKGEAWQDAADTYHFLVSRYPDSEFADRALRLAAYTYLDQLKEMNSAATAFEQLATEYPASEYRQEALTNAGFCFYQAADWESALRVNNLYLELWPDADNAASVMFGNAELYLKLEQVATANSIYLDFAARFPNDPRTVRAFFERGQYYLSHGDSSQAATEFRQTTARNRELAQGGHETGDYFAARALHYLVLREYDFYLAIQLLQPESRLEQLLEEKKAARAGLLDQLYELIAYTTRDLFHARYLIAAVHEDFANTYLAQEQQAYANQEEEIASLDRIDAAGLELSGIAMGDYLTAIEEMNSAMTVIATRQQQVDRRQRVTQTWLDTLPDSVVAPEDSLTHLVELKRSLALIDTSLVEGEHWIRESRQRVPAIAWASAERSEERIRMFYEAPIISGPPEIRLNYRDAVLSRFVLPATRDCITSYLQVLEHAGEVGLASSWRGRVQERFARFAGYPLSGYRELFELATTATSELADSFEALLERGEDAVNPDGMAAGDLGFYYLDLLDYRQTYLMNSLHTETELLESFRTTGIAAEVVTARGDSILYHILQSVRMMETDQLEAVTRRDHAWGRFEETSSWIWEDANATWDDAAFALSENILLTLTAADELITGYQLTGSIVKRIWFKLAQLNPEQFGDRFGLTEQLLSINTSTDWLVHTSYQRGFTEFAFDDSGWQSALATGNREIVTRSGLEGSGAVAIWWQMERESALQNVDTLTRVDTLQVDTLQVAVEQLAISDSLWFRHSFHLEDLPVAAELVVTADDNYGIYLNGEYIDEDRGGTEDWFEVKRIDLKDYVLSGDNLLAVEAVDEDGTGRGLLISFALRTVPRLTDELFEQKLRDDAETSQQQQRELERDRLYERHRIY